jgi:hypothetical protein
VFSSAVDTSTRLSSALVLKALEPEDDDVKSDEADDKACHRTEDEPSALVWRVRARAGRSPRGTRVFSAAWSCHHVGKSQPDEHADNWN